MKRPDLNFRRRLTVLLALAAGATLARADVKAGDLFPDLAAAGLEGAVPVTEHQVVLVDFWASWCGPCKASFPAYARLHADFSPRGLVIVAISVDQDEAAFAAFVRRMAPPFPVVRDKDQQLVRQVMVPAMPTSFLVGRDGRVRFVHRGFHGAETDTALRAEIVRLLDEKPSSP
jgi:thiol-disulfide isomerase/thioredoxin